MVTATPDAFLLLTLANASLSVGGATYNGALNLECVTRPVPSVLGGSRPSPGNRDVYLVLRINTLETALDPTKSVIRETGPGWRTYTFKPSDSDPTEMIIRLWPPLPNERDAQLTEDIETFDGILSQYVDVRSPGSPPPFPQTRAASPSPAMAGVRTTSSNDLRGHVVMINEDTGEVIGELDHKVRIREDSALGYDENPVILEIPEDDGDATTMEMFVRAIPPDQQDWMTKSATIISHAISTTTNLLLTTVTAASNYYINHSTPSPHHPDNINKNGGSPAPGTPGAPPPLPPRALVFLTSESTRKNLASVHAVSGKAVEVSSKTVSAIDGMIRRAMGGKPKPQAPPNLTPPQPGPGGPYRGPGPSYGPGQPPVYPNVNPYPSQNSAYYNPQEKPALPPRAPSGFASGPSLPPRTAPGPPPGVPVPGQAQPTIQLTKKARILFSLDLILSTLDDATRRTLDVGTENLGNIMQHKYGTEVAESSRLMAGTARNIALVYVDIRGVGRRALLKKAGKQYVKAKVSSGNTPHLEQYHQQQFQQQQQQPQGGYPQQGYPQQGYPQQQGHPPQGYYQQKPPNQGHQYQGATQGQWK
ncbi:hypothetical protein BDN72DRAFT_850918 [Pluteus cervinus]|uniref:Uncharacterized protein n=1 Tax=Pluteus cervinus TaxID=181527 RepID=A0ACD3A2X4_9AGAR|nr:hypothetical protein BDN72DRAFT_850918 [Pluteus cervinus]